MRISRLFVDIALETGMNVDLPEDAAHYVRTVLRLKKEQKITLFNGNGGEYFAQFTLVSKKMVTVHVESFVARSVESPLNIVIGMGISRGDRMDWSIQKAVESGAHRIIPLFTDHCVIKINAEKQQQRCKHWQAIIQHATEQSGRTILPRLDDCQQLKNWVVGRPLGLKLFLDPYAKKTMPDMVCEDQTVTLLTGPEGGFSEAERELAIASGFIPVKMGPRILRTETAVLSAIAVAQTLWGDFRR